MKNINKHVTAGAIITEYERLKNYLTIEALEDGLTAKLSTNACQYSTDGVTWTDLAAGTTTPAINTGDKLYFKASGLTPTSNTGIGTFAVNKQFNLSGNCMSMLFGDETKSNLDLTGKSYAFCKLFYNCKTLKSVSAGFLPATTLANSCYKSMFQDCSKLTTAPELPATTLASNCYSYMFQYCSKLTTAPELPATTLASECYNSMFYGCTSLVAAPELPATTLSNSCYYQMFTGSYVLPDCTNIDFSSSTVVASGGLAGLFAGTKVTDSDLRSILPINPNTGNYWLPVTALAINCYKYMFTNCIRLTTTPELPATTLANFCYQSMFSGCTALTSTSELPATTLANSCYDGMFSGCTALTSTSELPATTLARSCYSTMFSRCTSLTTAPELPATSAAIYCYDNMFSGCTALTEAPELPATTLADYCYRSMFSGCTALTEAPELPATTLANSCYGNMFYGCTSLTTAPELPATTLASYCYYSMFQNCSKLNCIKAMFTTTPGSSYTNNWVNGVASTGTFVKNVDATWDVTGASGIPTGWDVQFNITLIRCISLSITADDVSGKSTTTKIYWTAEIEGVDENDNNLTVTLTGTDTSESFPQNTSTTDTIERTISYTYMGVTATTTITQGIWVDSAYTVDLNNQWQSSSVTNPDSSLYDGVYESFSNKGVHNTAAIMYIDIEGYNDFDLYIRSYAESNYDYVMVSQLDQTINNSTSYSNTTLVKAHTRGNQKSGTSIDNYTKVSFTGVDGGQHRITIVYRKDSSSNSGDDRGYVLIPKNQ